MCSCLNESRMPGGAFISPAVDEKRPGDMSNSNNQMRRDDRCHVLRAHKVVSTAWIGGCAARSERSDSLTAAVMTALYGARAFGMDAAAATDEEPCRRSS